MTHAFRRVALAAILVLAGGVRFYGITDRGVFDYDEAWFLLEAKTIYNSGRYVAGRLGLHDDPDLQAGLRDYVKRRGTVPLTSIKPGHRALILAAMAVLGPHDYAGLLVSVLSGIATIGLIYLIGSRLFGRSAGLLAALCVAVSPLHVYYSRSLYAQSNVVFFAALGIWLWIRHHTGIPQRPAGLILPGLAVGWAFTCHFNSAWLPVGLVVLEALRGPEVSSALRPRLYRIATLGAAMSAPLLLFDLMGRCLKLAGLFPADYPTYLGQFLKRQSQADATTLGLAQIPFWTGRLLSTEGPLLVSLFLLGSALVIRRLPYRRLAETTVFGLLFVSLVPVSLIQVGGLFLLRNYALALLPLALLAGLAADRSIRWVDSRSGFGSAAGALLAAAIVVTGLAGSRDLLPIRSGYGDAARRLAAYIDESGGVVDALPRSAWPIWYFYLSEAYDSARPELQRNIRFYPETPNEGDFELLDYKRWYRAVLHRDDEGAAEMKRARALGRTVVSVANPAADLPLRFREAGGDRADSAVRETRRRFPFCNRIEVVDLRL